MNAAMEMLRSRATQLWYQIAGEESIELTIDPIEEPVEETPHREYRVFEPGHYLVDEVTARVHEGLNEQLSKALTASCEYPMNLCIEQLSLLTREQVKLKVWIYNISAQEYVLGNSVVRKLNVPACPQGESYAVVTSFPAVIVQPKPNINTQMTDYYLIDGRRLAMDLINPANLGIDQYGKFEWNSRFSVGTDFSKKGVFFSTHNPPLKKELKAAHKRLLGYYTDLVDRANIVRITSAATTLGVPTSEVTAAVQYVEGPHSTK